MKLNLSRFPVPDPLAVFLGLSFMAAVAIAVKSYPLNGSWYDLVTIEVTGKNWTNAFTPDGYNAPTWLCSQLKPGDTAKNPGGGLEAELVSLNCYSAKPQQLNMYLTVKLYTLHDDNTNTSSFQGKPIAVGAPIQLTLGSTQIIGQITGVNPSPQPTPRTFRITGRWANQSPKVINALRQGDSMVDRSDHTPVATLESYSLTSPIHPLILETGTTSSVTLKTAAAGTQDAILTLTMDAIPTGPDLIFAGNQVVKSGNALSLMVGDVYIDRLVVETITPPPNE